MKISLLKRFWIWLVKKLGVSRMKPMESPTKLEINDDFRKALELMNVTNNNVFLTGKAGTGKSTLLQHFRETTQKRIVILAPTGVAAVNVGGQTIHSFFKFGIGITPSTVRNLHEEDSIYKNIDSIVVDEISMVRADLLDCIDKFMRLNGKDKNKPFGGVQMIFVGDLYQLPPVVTWEEEEFFNTHYKSPFFFDSKVFPKTNFYMIELKKIYRQSEEGFIDILNAVRLGKIEDFQLEAVNKRHSTELNDSHKNHIFLVSTNDMATNINNRKLATVKNELFTFEALITGKFNRNFPTNEELSLKKGAQVLLLNNDREGRWVNGDLAIVKEIDDFNNCITVTLQENGKEHVVTPHQWEMIKYSYNSHSEQIDSEVIGTFTQFPLRLAWALTIHKGQGKTYRQVIVDFGQGTFAHGQAYVALSRCRSLEGLVLRTPLQRSHVLVDERVVAFMEKCVTQKEMF